jgi:hypothetical protein
VRPAAAYYAAAGWSRSLAEGRVQIKKGLKYRLDPVFLKMVKLFDAQGKWVDTRPLVLTTNLG